MYLASSMSLLKYQCSRSPTSFPLRIYITFYNFQRVLNDSNPYMISTYFLNTFSLIVYFFSLYCSLYSFNFFSIFF